MHDLLQQSIFYFFATVTVLAALLVVTQKNPVHSVLFLVLAFFTSAVLWLLLEAEFLALILVLVYVGAVMTLFLFVVMMLNSDQETLAGRGLRILPFGLVVIALLLTVLMKALPSDRFKMPTQQQELSQLIEVIPVAPSVSNTEALGLVLYTDYLAAFELAALLLLVAIVASITLVHRPPQASKRQNNVHQIMTRREERVTLVGMPAEK